MQFAFDLPQALDPRVAAIEALHRATAIYTHDAVIDTLLDRIGWPDEDGCLIDPSAGDGAFLARALERIDTPRHNMDSIRRLEGWEIHPGAVADGRERLAKILVRRDWSRPRADAAAAAILREGDFITDRRDGRRYRFVAGNPPYIRFGHLPEWFKSLYREALPDFARGDLLHAFLDRCVDLMTPDGIVGLVTSDRWLFNQTAAELRASIGARAGIAHLARLDPGTSFYQPKARRKGTPPRIHPVEIVLRRETDGDRSLTRAPMSLSKSEETASGITLGDIATIKIAPWLGPKGIFVVDAARAKGLPQECLIPCVDTDDVDPGTNALRTPQRWAIRTTRDREPTGAIRDHLAAEVGRMPKRGQGRLWWMPPETITLPLDRPALMIPRIGRTLRTIALPTGVLPINHNLYVIQTHGEWSLDRIKAAVESPRSQAWLRDNAPPLENGFYDCRSGILKRIPVA